MDSLTPSPQIDAAICDLISQISNYSDSSFDAHWCALKEEEIEAMVVLLIKFLIEDLKGGKLAEYLSQIREMQQYEFEEGN
jgi:hypothetical protein